MYLIRQRRYFFCKDIEESINNLQDAVDGSFQHHNRDKTVMLGIDFEIYMKSNLNSLALPASEIS